MDGTDYALLVFCNLLLPLAAMLQSTSIGSTIPGQIYGDDASYGRAVPPKGQGQKAAGKRLLWGGLTLVFNVYVGIFAPISRKAACIIGLATGIIVMVLLNRWARKNP